ncbi:DnaJ domain-containing protein [Candidatus Tisiphia endosymbiont of Thecophora atra]|uniref:DnaJ domain-containing protein n=1 Tax=Candidatus Tisiphia endosymbiont of Thecophora atra TaxID=3066258 RepID=UPI00312C7993
MKRSEAKRINRNTELGIEITSKILTNLTLDKCYSQEDIAKVMEHLTRKYGYDFVKQCEVAGSIDQLGKFLEKYEEADSEPRFIIYNKEANHWVTLCIMHIGQSTPILYKDSFGREIPGDIHDVLFKKFGLGTRLKVHANKEQQDSTSCGPMSLKNMEIIMSSIKGNQLDFIEHFETTQFCQHRQVQQVKEYFKSELGQYIRVTINKYILELSENVAFKVAIKNFVEKIPYEAFDKINAYGQALQQYFEKQPKEVCSEIVDHLQKEVLEKAREEARARLKQLRKEALENLPKLMEYVKTILPEGIKTAEDVDKLKRTLPTEVSKVILPLVTPVTNGIIEAGVVVIADYLPTLLAEPIKVGGRFVAHQVTNKIQGAVEDTVQKGVNKVSEVMVNVASSVKEKTIETIDTLQELVVDKSSTLAANTTKSIASLFIRKANDIIESQYSEELRKFTQIFDLLARYKVNEELENLLKDTCQKLNLDYDKVKPFFDLIKVRQENSSQQNNGSLQIDNANAEETNHLEKRTEPPLSTNNKSTEPNVKDLEQLLSEIVLGEDGDNSLESQTLKDKLREQFNQVKSSSLLWNSKSLTDIRSWADSKKGKLTAIDIYEAIAIMDRVNELITTDGHRLRDTQILSILVFLQTKNNQGKLCQIHTGEGKTTIVSLLAVIKVLQGETVDIITSNHVLAGEGVEQRENFYNAFGISVAHNNTDENKECYKANVLYGSIGNFQFDYLKDTFLGLGIRAGREFATVILDEVDSMIIDNAGSIAKLSTPFPSMESLRYVYIKIWQELLKAEKSLEKEIDKKLREKAQELQVSSKSEKDKETEYISFQHELTKSARETIKAQIKASDFSQIDTLIPEHLQVYEKAKLEQWIDNAIYAKYGCHENRQYIIKEKEDENVIIPVDYANTGVTLKNTVWSHGLHQFVQLKHNLHLTSESLTSSFISNLGYIKKYGNKIFGLTGTLGSIAEQELLSSIYNVDYAKIPTYKAKKFNELGGIVVADDHFVTVVALDALEKIEGGRACLIICETIEDLKNIEKALKVLQKLTKTIFSIKPYGDDSDIIPKELKAGTIIVATNIAGRGTDFQTTKELEENGGLHVCVVFLPCNQRVEDQAFGRTARQGKKGTAQLIIKVSEVKNLGIDIERLNDSDFTFKNIKEARNQKERERIKELQESKILELNFQDLLFSQFSEKYQDLQGKNQGILGFHYVLEDIKEFWAFWLEAKNFKGKELTEAKAKEEFEAFISLPTTKSIMGGKILHNPYYSMRQADAFLLNEQLQDAENALNHAIALTKTPEILHSAYIKLFEIAMERGGQMMERFKKALAKVISINVEKDETYKTKAISALEKAKEALDLEVSYIQKYFFANPQTDESQIQDFQNILIVPEVHDKENIFLKHLKSRMVCLNTYRNIIECLDKDGKVIGGLLYQIKEEFKDGVTIHKKIPDYLKTLDPNDNADQQLKQAITEAEISELNFVGLNAIYSTREVHDVPDNVITRVQAQIVSGLAALAAGLVFPPLLIVTGSAAGVLISEGICDIVMELISSGETEFNEAEYIKGKLISYGISIATMGIGAVASSMKILNNSIKACRGLSKAFKNSKTMKTIFNKVADKIDDIEKMLEKSLTKIKLEKSLKAQQFGELSRLEKLSVVTKSIGKETIMDVAGSVIMEKIVTKGLEELLTSLKPQIQKKISGTLSQKIDRMKIQLVEQIKIFELASEIITGSNGQIAAEIAKEIALGVARHGNNWKIKATSLVIDSIVTADRINQYPQDFCKKLNYRMDKKLQEQRSNILKNDNVDLLIEQLSKQVTEKIYSLIIHLSGKFAHTCVVEPTLSKVSQEVFSSASKSKASDSIDSEQNRQRKSEESDAHKNKCQEALKLLGLDEGASWVEIRKAYKTNALRNHPDKNPNEEASIRFQHIREAYDFLEVNHFNKVFGNSEAELKKTYQKVIINLRRDKDSTTDFNKACDMYEMLWPLKQITNEADVSTHRQGNYFDLNAISKALKVTITVHFKDKPNCKPVVIGEKHSNGSGNKVVELDYKDAHYTPHKVEDKTKIQSTGANNCLFDSLAVQLDHLGSLESNYSSGELIKIADKAKNSFKHKVFRKVMAFLESIDHGVPQYLYEKGQSIWLMGGAKLDHLESGRIPRFFGGSYGKLNEEFYGRIEHTEINHIPPEASYKGTPYAGISSNHRSAIAMELVHHRNEAGSLGAASSTGSEPYRDMLKKYLIQGKFWEALKVDCNDVLNTPKGTGVDRDYYAPSIVEMLNYIKDTNIPNAPNIVGIPRGRLINEEQYWQIIYDLNLEGFLAREDQSNATGNGLNDYDYLNYWNEYSKVAMEALLQLRLESANLDKYKIISPNYVWEGFEDEGEKLINEIISNLKATKDRLLVPLNLYGKHWVGIVIEKTASDINIIYMDSEQNTIPSLLKVQLTHQMSTTYPGYRVNLVETELEPQKYNNCGPEVIENLLSYLTHGDRLPQECAVLGHSLLLEDLLLMELS